MRDKQLEEIKVITIGIESVPKGFCSPIWLKMKPDGIKVSTVFSDGLDVTTMYDTNIRMEYPLEHFAVDKDQRRFYIRPKDKAAFVELLSGWIDKCVGDRVKKEVTKQVEEAVRGFAEWLVDDAEEDADTHQALSYFGDLADDYLSQRKGRNENR